MAVGCLEPQAEAVTVNSLADLAIGRVVGTGLTAHVHVAALRSDGTRCALKVIDQSGVAGEKAAAGILREKEILLAARGSPGVVRLFGTLKDAGNLYFVLEYLDGGELLWHMRRGRRRGQSPGPTAANAVLCRPEPFLRAAPGIDADAARIVTGSVVLALGHLYDELGVLYRDLKPTNLLFSSFGVLKLVDFGHAKQLTASPAENERSSSLVGTRHYHAPETVQGEPHGASAQLWALGVLIAEMINGVPPFWSQAEGQAGSAAERGGEAALSHGCELTQEDVSVDGGKLAHQDVGHSERHVGGRRVLHREEPRAPSLEIEQLILAAAPDLSRLPPGPRSLAASLLVADPVARLAAWPALYQSVRGSDWLAGLDWAAVGAGRLVAALDYRAHVAEAAEIDGIALEEALTEGLDDRAFESWGEVE
jgi:serine/threonine protein kinase